MHKRKN